MCDLFHEKSFKHRYQYLKYENPKIVHTVWHICQKALEPNFPKNISLHDAYNLISNATAIALIAKEIGRLHGQYDCDFITELQQIINEEFDKIHIDKNRNIE